LYLTGGRGTGEEKTEWRERSREREEELGRERRRGA